MEIRTDLSNFEYNIPDDEYFISPIVDVLAPAETNTSSYTLRIPHCLDEDDDKTKMKVRMIHENRNPAVVEVPKGNAGALYYDIDDKFIELHTKHFCQIVCTICQTPYHCLDRVINFCFAKFETHQQKERNDGNIQHQVEIRPYFCSVPNIIRDFREVIIIFEEHWSIYKCLTHCDVCPLILSKSLSSSSEFRRKAPLTRQSKVNFFSPIICICKQTMQNEIILLR